MIHEPSPYALVDVLVDRHVDTDARAIWQRMLADLHPKQRAFVEDPSPRKCGLKGRRAGGSYGVAAWLCKGWPEWAGLTSLFVAQTKEHAKSILWGTLELFSERYGLGLHFNGLELSATFPNGYQILLRGAKDTAQIEKLRGFARGLVKAAVDETGSFFAHDELLRYLVRSVLAPQLMDHAHKGAGQLALLGSPGLDAAGLYYELTTGQTHEGKPVLAWPTHRWTALDNPYLDAAAYYAEELASGHILDDTPPAELVEALIALKDVPQDDPRWAEVAARLSAEFRREYLAHWTRDRASLVYVPSERNLIRGPFALPPGVYRITIGCDLGWGDGNGFAVAAKRLDSPEIYVLEAYYVPELGTHQIAQELERLRLKYRTGEVYVDTGGEGTRLLVDLENYGVFALAAGKGRKRPRIEYVRSVLANGSLQVVVESCGALLTEWTALPWSLDRQEHRPGFVDDVSDAVLMAVNPHSQRFSPDAARPPRPGEPGYEQHRDRLELEAAQRKGRRLRRQRRAA